MRLLLIGFGGFVGSILRYATSGWMQQLSHSTTFPFGTLGVNLIGCLIIGALSQLAETRGAFTAETRALVFIGILGGFTTFSTFSNETFNLLRSGEIAAAFLNLAAHLVLGIGAVWAGRALAFVIWR
ncbi:MAG: fluoride efflux transporter CrcB [Thermoflexales bacterium]|nr:fluoride efflux transporter CrcB [Thermoflexales bacterium]